MVMRIVTILLYLSTTCLNVNVAQSDDTSTNKNEDPREVLTSLLVESFQQNDYNTFKQHLEKIRGNLLFRFIDKTLNCSQNDALTSYVQFLYELPKSHKTKRRTICQIMEKSSRVLDSIIEEVDYYCTQTVTQIDKITKMLDNYANVFDKLQCSIHSIRLNYDKLQNLATLRLSDDLSKFLYDKDPFTESCLKFYHEQPFLLESLQNSYNRNFLATNQNRISKLIMASPTLERRLNIQKMTFKMIMEHHARDEDIGDVEDYDIAQNRSSQMFRFVHDLLHTLKEVNATNNQTLKTKFLKLSSEVPKIIFKIFTAKNSNLCYGTSTLDCLSISRLYDKHRHEVKVDRWMAPAPSEDWKEKHSWKFIWIGRNRFVIRSALEETKGESLQASSVFEDDRNFLKVFTWRGRKPPVTGVWLIQPVGTNFFRIQNEALGSYLHVKNQRVFTWQNDGFLENDALWTVK